MKVVLSRKGLDSSFGANAGNLLIFNQDKTNAELVMLPIPESDGYVHFYWDIFFRNRKSKSDDKFSKLFENFKFLKNYVPNRFGKLTDLTPKDYWAAACHNDPNIANFFMCTNFLGTFGQVGQAQMHLENQKVGVGDLFIFFGLFNECIDNGNMIELNASKQKHIMFGYLQIGDIIKTSSLTESDIEYYKNKYPYIWDNPHWDKGYNPERWPDYMPMPDPFPDKYRLHKKHYFIDKTNCIYVARETCTFDDSIKGYGMFEFNEDLVLTKQGDKCPSHWQLPKELQGLKISYHSEKSQKQDYFQSAKRGQEFVIEESPQAEQWAINLIKQYAKR